jgi:predicted  nucleic acid-binding Zn-ribbon protein
MKREFLEKLGLSKEAIDAVMAEHGKSTTELRLRSEALTKAEADLTALAEEVEGLKASLAEAKGTFAAFRDKTIAAVLADARPSSALARAELIRRLTQASEEGKDLTDTLRQLREEDPDAFAEEDVSLPVFTASCASVAEGLTSLSAMKGR